MSRNTDEDTRSTDTHTHTQTRCSWPVGASEAAAESFYWDIGGKREELLITESMSQLWIKIQRHISTKTRILFKKHDDHMT